MIGKIKGKIAEIDGRSVLVETASGIFYSVFLTPLLIKGRVGGDSIEVYTYLQVKEDGWALYGFEEKKQLKLFTMLLSVPGIGPKSAYMIISSGSYAQIFDAISTNNVHFFTGISGVGRKTAQKILLELSGKIGKTFDLAATTLSPDDKIAVDALVSLGFAKNDSQQAVAKIKERLSVDPDTIGVEEKIKQAMKILTHVKSTT